MHLSSIQRPTTLVEEVCQRLSRTLTRPGAEEWLPPERQLAEQLGVSRTVVREATKRLELQGLLEVKHGVGIRRSDSLHKPLNGSLALLIPDEGDRLRQSLEVRLAIEPEVARLAAQRAKPSHLRDLRKVQRALQGTTDLMEGVEADIEFHRLLAKATGNGVFSLLLETIADLGRDSRRATISHAGVKRAVEHHEAVLAAVERRDAVAASLAMRHHIEVAVQDFIAHQNRKSQA